MIIHYTTIVKWFTIRVDSNFLTLERLKNISEELDKLHNSLIIKNSRKGEIKHVRRKNHKIFP